MIIAGRFDPKSIARLFTRNDYQHKKLYFQGVIKICQHLFVQSKKKKQKNFRFTLYALLYIYNVRFMSHVPFTPRVTIMFIKITLICVRKSE